MHQKKRIRTVVITGKSVKRLLKGLFFIVICFVVAGLSWCALKIPTPSITLSREIISRGLNDNSGTAPFLERVLGFDMEDTKTILYRFHAQFDKVERVVEAVESAPPQNEIVKVNNTAEGEYDIKEVNAAKGMQVSNLSGIAVSPEILAAQPLNIQLDNSGPQVLIVHTHTTESFTDSGKTKYSLSDSDRSTDSNKNVVAVGEVIKSVLEENGISVVHDTTVHDYPSYSGAYTRSMTTIKNNLKKYPSIKVVLDVHRDGIVRDDGTKVKVAADIGGEKAAQCMFVVGTNAQLTHDHWQDNMRLACKLQSYANANYPGLMRAINVRKERFNQQASRGSVIVEVGSNGNTLEEAKAGAKLMAKTISAVLKNQ